VLDERETRLRQEALARHARAVTEDIRLDADLSPPELIGDVLERWVLAPAANSDRRLRSMPYAEYLRTPEWRNRRRDKIRAAGRRCERCRAQGVLHVHHLTYDRRGQEAWSDLLVLCRSCHMAEHGVTGTEPDPEEAALAAEGGSS
jgi:5-methylcytosine-specific restriction endonuclease McrA